MDILFTGLMCIAVLFVLAWLIFLQEQIDQWFDVLDLDEWKFLQKNLSGANFGLKLYICISTYPCKS